MVGRGKEAGGGKLWTLRLPDPDLFLCLLLSYFLHGKKCALISGASGSGGRGAN